MAISNDIYFTIEQPATGQYKDRGSKFLAFAYHIDSEAGARNILDTLKKEYHDAHHHCYAFRLNPEHNVYRYGDGGEPSGTAGRPIYEQILSRDLYDIMVVVVRYFGGIMLGTGGLYNAYKQAARDALEHVKIIEKIMRESITLHFDYDQMNTVMQIFDREHLAVISQQFTTSCILKTAVRKRDIDRVVARFSTSGKIRVEKP